MAVPKVTFEIRRLDIPYRLKRFQAVCCASHLDPMCLRPPQLITTKTPYSLNEMKVHGSETNELLRRMKILGLMASLINTETLQKMLVLYRMNALNSGDARG
jgi:hypothetical protein